MGAHSLVSLDFLFRLELQDFQILFLLVLLFHDGPISALYDCKIRRLSGQTAQLFPRSLDWVDV